MERQDCAGSSSQGPPQGRGGTQPRGIKQLPRFDAGVMETYLDDMRDMKAKVYQMFREHPELLPNVEEGLSKGETRYQGWLGVCSFQGIAGSRAGVGRGGRRQQHIPTAASLQAPPDFGPPAGLAANRA